VRKFELLKFSLFILILFYSCKKFIYDKQIRIEFPDVYRSVDKPGWQYSTSIHNITNFNINYYPDIDSIFFIAYIGTYAGGDTCHVMLYNVTDSLDIQDSYLVSTKDGLEQKKSKNLINSFPNKEIELGYKIRYGNKPYAELTQPIILMYRK
jgi:hypothetical protein